MEAGCSCEQLSGHPAPKTNFNRRAMTARRVSGASCGFSTGQLGSPGAAGIIPRWNGENSASVPGLGASRRSRPHPTRRARDGQRRQRTDDDEGRVARNTPRARHHAVRRGRAHRSHRDGHAWQTRRGPPADGDVRFRENNSLAYVHTLNGTAITALAMLAILENFQDADGSIAVPTALWEFGAPHRLGVGPG
jgi:hypothetical protein